MSSPIANKNPTRWEKHLVDFHQKSAHSNRISKLANCLVETMDELFAGRDEPIPALDVGCGDMSLAELIGASNPKISWTCTDIHELPEELKQTEKWKKYCPFNGNSLPFSAGSFDVVLFSDVLHHCLPKAIPLLMEALRVGRFVIVKDHFEQGVLSRQMLRLMDFVGNYGYRVEIPTSYFTRESFQKTCMSASADIISQKIGIDLYSGFPLLKYVLSKNWQFVAVLAKSEQHQSP